MSVGQTHVSAKFVSNMSITSLASLWATNTVKAGIMTNAVVPGINDSDPRWGAGGSQNYSTAEVTPGGNYSADRGTQGERSRENRSDPGDTYA